MQIHNLKTQFQNFSDAITLTVLLILSLVLTFQPLPVKQEIAKYLGFPLLTASQKAVDRAFEIQRMRDENRQLKDVIARLTLEKADLSDDAAENLRLSKVLDCTAQLARNYIVARVIGYDSQRLEKALTIDKGSTHGIQRNWAVLTYDGIVGKTLVVNESTTIVQLLQDRNCKVSVIDSRSREVGVMTWDPDPKKGFHLVYTSPRPNIQIGDTLVTSGYSGIFPKNLAVGRVAHIEFIAQQQQLEAIIEPFANINALEEVIVVSPDKLIPDTTVIVDGTLGISKGLTGLAYFPKINPALISAPISDAGADSVPTASKALTLRANPKQATVQPAAPQINESTLFQTRPATAPQSAPRSTDEDPPAKPKPAVADSNGYRSSNPGN